jgi:hypothetical protein
MFMPSPDRIEIFIDYKPSDGDANRLRARPVRGHPERHLIRIVRTESGPLLSIRLHTLVS